MTKQTTSPREFYDQVAEQYNQAELHGSEVRELFYEIAGFKIALRFIGDVLLPVITPALAHLQVNSTNQQDLTIHLWDSESTGIRLPNRPWGENDHVSRGDIKDFSDPDILTAYTLGPNALSLLDKNTNQAIFCTTDAAHIPTDYRGSPLLVILSWWMAIQGLQYIHAGAVGTSDDGVLLVGKGGSGKSTSALSCIDSSLLYAADDYCLLDPRGSVPIAHSIYNSAKLEANHIERLPHLVPLISNSEHLKTAKAVLYLQDNYPEKIVRSFNIRALLIPHVTGQPDTTLSPASQMEALHALAPSTLFQLSGTSEANFATMANFVRSVPSYFLNAGTDLNQIPETIQQLLKRLRSAD